nr:MAG TPA: hypothetical protein [Caudoviricetes sp.]
MRAKLPMQCTIGSNRAFLVPRPRCFSPFQGVRVCLQSSPLSRWSDLKKTLPFVLETSDDVRENKGTFRKMSTGFRQEPPNIEISNNAL